MEWFPYYDLERDEMNFAKAKYYYMSAGTFAKNHKT